MGWQQMDEQLVNFLQRTGAAVLVLIAAVVLYQLVMRGLARMQQRANISEHLMKVVRRVLRWTMVVVVLLLMLQCYGLLANAWTTLTAVLGLVAIGFVAVWSVLSNMLCSMMLLVSRPFEVGDTIEIPADDLRGKVVDFNLLFTKLRDEDDSLIQIPNNTFFQKPIRRRSGAGGLQLDEQLMRHEPAMS